MTIFLTPFNPPFLTPPFSYIPPPCPLSYVPPLQGLQVLDGGMTIFSGGLSLVGYPGGFGPAQFGLKVRSMDLYVIPLCDPLM